MHIVVWPFFWLNLVPIFFNRPFPCLAPHSPKMTKIMTASELFWSLQGDNSSSKSSKPSSKASAKPETKKSGPKKAEKTPAQLRADAEVAAHSKALKLAREAKKAAYNSSDSGSVSGSSSGSSSSRSSISDSPARSSVSKPPKAEKPKAAKQNYRELEGIKHIYEFHDAYKVAKKAGYNLGYSNFVKSCGAHLD